MPEYTWDVHLPGEDLPHRVTTDYLVGDGEEIEVDGREWLVERVDIEDDDETPITGVVHVEPPRDAA